MEGWTLQSGFGTQRLGKLQELLKYPFSHVNLTGDHRNCSALLQGHTALVCQVQLSPTMLVTGGSDGRVISFALAPPGDPSRTSVYMQRLVPHDSSVTGLQFDSRFLVTGGNDGRVRLFEYKDAASFNPESGEAPGRFEYVRELSDISESVWKVAYSQETCAIVCKRGGKTQLEIWSFKPKETA